MTRLTGWSLRVTDAEGNEILPPTPAHYTVSLDFSDYFAHRTIEANFVIDSIHSNVELFADGVFTNTPLTAHTIEVTSPEGHNIVTYDNAIAQSYSYGGSENSIMTANVTWVAPAEHHQPAHIRTVGEYSYAEFNHQPLPSTPVLDWEVIAQASNQIYSRYSMPEPTKANWRLEGF